MNGRGRDGGLSCRVRCGLFVMLRRNWPSILLAISTCTAVLLVSIPCVWAILYFGVYIGYGNLKVRGHQDFAANCVSAIEPAAQMDRLFTDCRHYITYGPNDVPLFNSVAYFGERYILTMQVPVKIESESSGAMIGETRFYLNECAAVDISPTGQVGASFSRNLDFGAEDWKLVHEADGDFSKLGFTLNSTPVANFQRFAGADRPSN